MPIAEFLDVLMFASVCVLLLLGFPVAFTLAGTALSWALIGWGLGVFDMSFFGALPSRIYGNAMTNDILVAVPLFIFMGVMLERSKVAEELLDTMGKLFGQVRGGLGFSVAIVGALMAASTGIVGATVVTMGLLSLPTMLRRGYDQKLAAGAICASGTLGQIIPPSIVLVLLGDQISNAYTTAQREMGNWSPEPVSVGDLFAGALLPGLMLVGLYIGYQALVAFLRPSSSPPIPRDTEETGSAMLGKVLHALIPPIVLIIAVLGSILAGVATPTEAASVGAVGATLLAGLRLVELNALPAPSDRFTATLTRLLDNDGRSPVYIAFASLVGMLLLQNFMDLRILRDEIPTGDWIGIIAAMLLSLLLAWGLLVCLLRVWRAEILRPVARSTLQITSMVFIILIGATVFSLVFRGLGGDELVQDVLTNMPGGIYTAVAIVMLVMFVLGFFLDFIEITFVVVPLVAPVLLQSDISPVWLGVMMAMNLQTSFLTPPFGFALFYLRGVAPKEVSTKNIYLGALPFVGIQLIGLTILALFPGIATWLPGVIFG
ncbi:TRAP transporter large permease [Rhodovibrio salinarum]|uniref:Tripartite transporter n=1 Tax=Rhodovibrio salinarum TaxID=1087 RepID=A0A934QJ86_9PROT|nr:TRAP transporter large permease subunit [Rhodovibrio salinarum]MBK1697879.1 tripartite transporter [Rhodovibrio salinarum]